MPPSGKIPTHSPARSFAWAVVRDALACWLPRSTGMWPNVVKNQRGKGLLKSSAMARNRTLRPRRSPRWATAIGSKSEMWFDASSTGPRSGMCSSPVMRRLKPNRIGRPMA